MAGSASAPNLSIKSARARGRSGSGHDMNSTMHGRTARSQSPPTAMDAIAAVPLYAGDSRPLSPMRYMTAEQKQMNQIKIGKSKNKKLLLEFQQSM
jgi:hypothetical protein